MDALDRGEIGNNQGMLYLLPAALVPAALALLTPPVIDDTSRRMMSDRDGAVLSLPDEDDAFVFAVFGDRTGGDPVGIEVLRQAVSDTNLFEPDLVMTVGDLVQGYNTRPFWMLQMGEFKSVMNDLSMPWFPVAGNHDIYWRGPDRPAREHEGDYEAHFAPLWYAFDHKGCRFIVLYTDEGNPKTDKRSFGDPASQRMSEGQFDWLKETLASAGDKRHVFVFMHHPRWRGGGYGDDWSKVHDVLVEAGNVTAVFAGHVHRLQHDGLIDGIEYLSLATVGGHLRTDLPAGGWLDHVILVTVRDDHATMATVPVGGVMNPRAFTPEHLARVQALRGTAPRVSSTLTCRDGRPVLEVIEISLVNPTTVPVQVDLHLDSTDGRWVFDPDHVHETIDAGEALTLPLHIAHPGMLDALWGPPRVDATAAFIDGGARWRVPLPSTDVPVQLQLDAWPERPASLDVRGAGGLVVPAKAVQLDDGPITLECWVQPRDLKGRRALVAKTEQSEYALFATDGVPYFAVYLGDEYVSAKAPNALKPDVWHHVAGVFDGTEVRLYVDGVKVAATKGRGPRRRNDLPLIVGADVNGNGQPTSTIDGRIDGVRLSDVVRYSGLRMTPQLRPRLDGATKLLLNMDGRVGDFVPDASTAQAHGRLRGGATIVDGDALVR